MDWDLGIRGLALLIAMSVAFGAIAQAVAGRRTTRWLGPIGAAVYLVAGLFVSEVWFGWATEEDLQPNIDGLSFDEVLLLALIPAVVAVVLVRAVARRNRKGTDQRPVPTEDHEASR